MASNNQQQQEANTVEQINSQLTSASEKIANNKKVIYWVIGIILACAVFMLSYLFIYRNPKLNKSFDAYNKVEMTAMGNDSVAAAEYKKVADKYGASYGGNLACLSAGEALYNTGKYDEAAKYIKKFSTSDPVLMANSLVLLGDCYVNTKKYDDAIKAYNDALSKAGKNDQIAPRVLLKEANIYDAQKKYDKALECYQTIEREYPHFQLGNGMEIAAYIEREKARIGK